ncbi:MAG: hypothetical protein K0S22_196 [Oscillospiraceae bacterium]|jgi:uncharacterized lipoprotein NlpE involved in copper resistance|nr:hypothetical protein [Oscillospiraceae bacterium]
MKRIKKSIVAVMMVLIAFSLIGCNQKTDKITFSATIMRVDDQAILVRPGQDTNEYKSADLISVGLSNTEITDANGKKIVISALPVGSKVDITYGGVILESYPAQINDCTKLVAYVSETQIPNPMVAFDKPDFRFVAGFALEGMPESINTDGVWLISGKIAQLDVSTADDTEGMLRCAKNTGEDISGLYGMSFDTQTFKQFGDVEAELSYTENGKALARWQRDGYDYVLWFPEIQTDTFLAAAESVVVGVKAVEGF